MTFNTFKLYQLKESYDEFGNSNNIYEFICDIELSISATKVNSFEDGIMYTTFSISGITPYENFIDNEKYKVVYGHEEYLINSINRSRLNILDLKRVVK